jgi:hypothetical protein
VTPDMTGATHGSYRVIGRAARTDSQYRAYWRVVCAPDLGGCGAERDVRADNLRSDKRLRCLSCAVTTSPGRMIQARSHGKTLTQPIWPRACKTCGEPFTGTARQVYCGPDCKPKPGPRARPRKGRRPSAKPS